MPTENNYTTSDQNGQALAAAGQIRPADWESRVAGAAAELFYLDCQLALFGARMAARPERLSPDTLMMLARSVALPGPVAAAFLFRRFKGAGWCSDHDLPALADRQLDYQWIIVGYPTGYMVHGVVGGAVGEIIIALPFA